MYSQARIPEITVDALRARPDGVDAAPLLLDVRELDEWAAGHAPDAVHLPMMQIPGRTDELAQDRETVVVCRVGSRSGQVVAFLRARGFDRVVNLAGGMYAWEAAGLPMVSETGAPPVVR